MVSLGISTVRSPATVVMQASTTPRLISSRVSFAETPPSTSPDRTTMRHRPQMPSPPQRLFRVMWAREAATRRLSPRSTRTVRPCGRKVTAWVAMRLRRPLLLLHQLGEETWDLPGGLRADDDLLPLRRVLYLRAEHGQEPRDDEAAVLDLLSHPLFLPALHHLVGGDLVAGVRVQ